MKIGFDLRYLKTENSFSDFIISLVVNIIKNKPDNNYILYSNRNIKLIGLQNVEIKVLNKQKNSFFHKVNFNKILKKDNNHLMIFFGGNKPFFYNKDYYVIIESLKDIFYPNFSNSIKKHINNYLLGKTLKKANKIINFHKNTKNEIIEKYNIEENKIEIINGYFPIKKYPIQENIPTKYNIEKDYLIYSSGIGIEKNIDKIIQVLSQMKDEAIDIDLVLLGENVEKDLSIRESVINNKMQKSVHFLGKVTENEKVNLYNKAIGVIFPSLYESFPFCLTEGILLNTRILSSNISPIKDVMGDKISYFSPTSLTDINSKIKEFYEKKDEIMDYKDIIEKYNSKDYIDQLFKIIN